MGQFSDALNHKPKYPIVVRGKSLQSSANGIRVSFTLGSGRAAETTAPSVKGQEEKKLARRGALRGGRIEGKI